MTTEPCKDTTAEQLRQLVQDADAGYANRPEGVEWGQGAYCDDDKMCFFGFAMYAKLGEAGEVSRRFGFTDATDLFPVLKLGKEWNISFVMDLMGRNDADSTRSYRDARRKIIRALEAATGCKLGL